MAENGELSEDKEDAGLDVVFKELKVDKSWDTSTHSDGVLHATISDAVFKGKINKRSPLKDKDFEPRMQSKRIRPYETDDLPFGENLEHLTFQSEECKNSKCTCNRKHRGHQPTHDLLNFANACKSPVTSPERKVIKDSRFKLHHKEKDHKVVLRAARLKLHRLRWYKGPVLKKGTLNKDGVFGEGNQNVQTDFGVLAKKSVSWSGMPHLQQQSEQYQSPPYTRPQLGTARVPTLYGSATNLTSTSSSWLSDTESFSVASASKLNESCDTPRGATSTHCPSPCPLYPGSEASRDVRHRHPTQASGSPCPLHPGKCTRPCSCAEQARMDATDYSVDELASYLDEFVYIPKKMSEMAEMMYT